MWSSGEVPLSVDTRPTVSTIRENFFRYQFETWGLQAANGLPIPYLAYLELEIEFCGQILVIKDPFDGNSQFV